MKNDLLLVDTPVFNDQVMVAIDYFLGIGGFSLMLNKGQRALDIIPENGELDISNYISLRPRWENVDRSTDLL